jgi:HKD family nuclease
LNYVHDMDIRHQPYGGFSLGDELTANLDSGEFQSFDFMVAFAKQSGVLRLKPALERFRAAGNVVNAIVGIDMDGTSYDALCSLLEITDSLHVVHSESMTQTFHSKVYAFTALTSVRVTVGSNNLTYSGLWRNFESSATSVFDLADPVDVTTVARLHERFAAYRDVTSGVSMHVEDISAIDQLRGHGYVKTELSINVGTRGRQRREARGPRLFAAEQAHSSGPALATVVSLAPGAAAPSAPRPRPSTSIPTSAMSTWVGEAFWTESRAMTSAARNQLDLSMSGRVETGDAATAGYAERAGWAVGSVSFFGINPTAQREVRHVTLNYKGTDYRDNRVYFPDSVEANGTWRIQLNGTDQVNRRLDHVVGPNGFVEKILVFQRIADDYYALSVLEMSHLESIRLASAFDARNGGTSSGKLYGVFSAVE